MTIQEFFANVARDLAQECEPRCGCPASPKRTVDEVIVTATINGEPYIYSLPTDGDRHDWAAFADLVRA